MTIRTSLHMSRLGKGSYPTHSKMTRNVSPNQTKQALKVLKAHNKFGKDTLSSDQIDEIPGLETLPLNDRKGE